MSPTVTARRHVRLQGAHNVRDLGGYESRFGGSVRWGRLYRGARLDRLSDTDVETLRSIDLAVVYDVRTITERQSAPDVIPSMHVPVLAGDSPADFDFDAVTDRQAGSQFLVDLSIRMLEHAAPEIGSIVFSLAEESNVPMLFHCTAGKDRTGVLAAVILELLGVSRSDVLDDYELSANRHRPSDVREAIANLAAVGVPAEAIAGLLDAPRPVMTEVLAWLDQNFGGVERYLSGPGRVDTGAFGAIRNQLLA